MRPDVDGYRLGPQIHRSTRSAIWQAVRLKDDLPVVLKTHSDDHPLPRDLARLQREFRLLERIAGPGVVGVHGLERWGSNLALVLEDCGATSLADQGLRPLAVESFLPLAIGVVRALSTVHRHVVHKDLTPDNILWNRASGDVRIVDFAMASEFRRERQVASLPERLEGSLPYLSPEQTGRMNRDVDARSDFYSLGMTFYALLCGRLPFAATDPLEWIHYHIARQPEPPQLLNSLVPEALGDLICKLLAKNPEDRYQCIRGLVADLEALEGQWLATGRIERFELGSQDVASTFEVPQRLYGRDAEVATVLGAFEAAAAGARRLVMLSGPAGIGKSAVVKEVQKPIAARRGFFLEGKVDPCRRVPYAALTQALEGAVAQILAEPEDRVATWKTRLNEALWPNGRIALDLAPAFETVMGPQPALIPLDPAAQKNRFFCTAGRLIAVFARRDHPLVLFLDDLQWTSEPTLALLRSLLDDPEIQSLLVIGAYRNDEIAPGDPLLPALESFERTTRPDRLDRLELSWLAEPTVNRIVADTLHADTDRTRALAELVYRQTHGNPFFLKEVLRSLHVDGLVAFDPGAGRWTWNMAEIRQAPSNPDLVAFMADRLNLLPEPTRTQLRLAAFLGSTFGLTELAAASGATPRAAAKHLWPAISEGLVIPLSENSRLAGKDALDDLRYRFLHDRVQQGAYALLAQEQRAAEHLRIGRLLLAGLDPARRAEHAVAVVNHLNLGRALIADPAGRIELAELNLEAARRSKETVAYRPAFDFLTVALDLLPPDSWQTHYELTFATHQLYSTCAYLCGESELARSRSDELLAHARSRVERVHVRILQAALHTFGDRLEEAITAAMQATDLLGIKLTRRPSPGTVAAELVAARIHQGWRKPADLDSARELIDPGAKLAIKALSEFLAPAFLTGNDTLFCTTMLKRASLCLRHGNGPEAAPAYASYTAVLAGIGDLEGARDFGRLAIRLLDRYRVQAMRSYTILMYALFSHSWSHPWRELDPLFKQGLEAGLEEGDYLFVAFACCFLGLWNPDIDLPTAIETRVALLDICKRTGHINAIDPATFSIQFFRALRGETAGPLSLSGGDFDEARCLERMTRASYESGLVEFRLYKLMAACMAAQWDAAWHELQEGEIHAKGIWGSPFMVELTVYGFMAAAAIASRRGPDSPKARARMRRYLRQMRRWTRHCPENFGHHALLMEAECNRLDGRIEAGTELYERATDAADRSGYLRYRAHAHEAAASFHREHGSATLAKSHLKEAYYLYLRWGATLKVEALETAFPELLATRTAGSLAALATAAPGPSDGMTRQTLDLSTIMKAAAAIAAEIAMPRLLERLIAIMVESAGARRGALFLSRDGELRLEALLDLASGRHEVLQGTSLADARVCEAMVRLAFRLGEPLAIDDARTDPRVNRDPQVVASRARSLLCLPLRYRGGLNAVLYLENDLTARAFDSRRIEILTMLAVQAAVSIENAEFLSARAETDSLRERIQREQLAYFQEMDRIKANFINAASHELRTPLSSIKGYAEFLEDEIGGPLSETNREYVREIHEGAERLRRLVDDLLDFARIEAGTFQVAPQEADLVQVLTAAVSCLRPQAQKAQVTVEQRQPDSRLLFVMDPARIEQVVLNLLGNAIKFTPPGGSIDILVGVQADSARVEIRDSGIGIADRDLPRIFERFFQSDSSTTREHGGAGLGLAISKALVEAHGGTIGAMSQHGLGSTFWFTLPLKPLDGGLG